MVEVKRVEEMDYMIESSRIYLISTLLNVRTATDIELFLSNENRLKDFKDFLDHWDIEYHLERNIENTELENFYALMNNDPEIEELLDKELKVRVYINRDRDMLEKFVKYRESWRKDLMMNSLLENFYHRLAGEFYGYPDEDVNAFIYRNSSEYVKKIRRLLGNPQRSILADEAVEKYGSLDEDEKRAFISFTNHVLADNEHSFRRQLRTVRRRKEALESNDIDTEKYMKVN